MVEELIQELRQKLGISIIMVSHNLDQAARMNGTLIVLHQGKIIEMGPSEEILHNPREIVTKQFITGELK